MLHSIFNKNINLILLFFMLKYKSKKPDYVT